MKVSQTIRVRSALITLQIAGSGPFHFGQAFAEGEFPEGVASSIPCQINPMCRWPDGSIKHGIVSGDSSGTFTLSPGPAAAPRPALQLPLPPMLLDFGALGKVDLTSSLTTTDFAVGPMMSSRCYTTRLGPLRIWFYVRAYASGEQRVTYCVDNSDLDNGAGQTSPRNAVSYTLIAPDGTYTVNQYPGVGLSGVVWFGSRPEATVLPDVAYLRHSKLIPPYEELKPDDGALAALKTNYVVDGIADWRAGMGGGGYHGQIGLLPLWESLLAVSGDVRALRATECASRSLRSYPMAWRDKKNGLAIKPNDFANWAVSGPGRGGTDTVDAPGKTWEIHHHGGVYLAYLTTGDPFHLDTMALQAALVYLCNGLGNGQGTQRLLQPGQIRGIAWSMRTVGLYAAIAPEGDLVAAQYRKLLENSYAHWYAQGPGNPKASPMGWPISIGNYNSVGNYNNYAAPIRTSPWMYHFWMGVNGFLSDVKPGFDPAKHLAVRDWMYKGAVGILGGTGAGQFHFTKASSYTIVISPELTDPYTNRNPDNFFANWGEVWQGTFNAANAETSNMLLDEGFLDCTSYWANLKPAIAYAVSHGAPGAKESYARFTGADNYQRLHDSGFKNIPIWSVVPQ